MSLYNMVMGVNPYAGDLLALAGVDPEKIARFRDVILKEGRVGLLTRTGGGNRPNYVEANDYLRSVKTFAHDHDDNFDRTFAWFWYTLPAAERAIAEQHFQEGVERCPQEMVDLSTLAMRPDANVKDPRIERARAAAERMMQSLMNAMNNGGDMSIRDDENFGVDVVSIPPKKP